MAYFSIKFDTNNDAFVPPREEIARILRAVADRVENGDSMDKHRNVSDINGNIVGTFVHKET